MSDVFDLYGLLGIDIDTAATLLTETLQVSFDPHDSDFWGEYYLAHNEDWTEEISLKENFNKMEDEWNNPEFKDYPLTLEVSSQSMSRAREVEESLSKMPEAKITLLRRKEYPTKKG